MKPMSLTTPESIAQEYGGNKQKIAEAARMGLVDPTAAVMAGMFIDRMRNAAVEEQKPNTTVAQDVLGAPQPQVPPQGIPGQPPAPVAAPQARGIPGAQMAAQAAQAAPQAAPGVEGLPAGNVGNYAGGGMVALAGGITDAQARAMGYGSAQEYFAFQDRFKGNEPDTGAVPVDSTGVAAVAPRLDPRIDPRAANNAVANYDQKTASGLGSYLSSQAPAAAKTDKDGLAVPDPEANFARAKTLASDLVPIPQELSQDTAIAENKDLMQKMGVDTGMYERHRQKLEEERASSKQDRQDAINSRILEAGLGIMAGESPHAFVNIGKGATPAMQGLAQDIKDIKKADKELTRAQMALDASENQFKVDQSKGVQQRLENNQNRVDKAEQARANATATLGASMNQLTGATYGAQKHDVTSRATAQMAKDASVYATDKEQREIKQIAKDKGISYSEAVAFLGRIKNPEKTTNAMLNATTHISQRVAKAWDTATKFNPVVVKANEIVADKNATPQAKAAAQKTLDDELLKIRQKETADYNKSFSVAGVRPTGRRGRRR